MKGYFLKMRGGAKKSPRNQIRGDRMVMGRLCNRHRLCGYLSSKFFEAMDLTLLIGSFGASAVLIYGAPKSPFAQPRNVIGGHMLSG